MEKLGVSVILPTYNRAHMIKKSIDSVLSQTYSDFELIIIDDGSTDGTEEIISEYKDDRIVFRKLEENGGGQSKARNFGIQMAKYDYLAFEDSDDIWYPNKLELQMKAIQNTSPKVGMVYHKMKYEIPEYGTVVLPQGERKRSGNIYKELLYDNMIGMPTLLVKKACVEDVGLLDESFNCLEDWDWVLRIAKKYEAIFIDEILLDSDYSVTGVSGKSYAFVMTMCKLVLKYKKDLLETNTLNHRLEIILRDSERLGIRDEVVNILERIMKI